MKLTFSAIRPAALGAAVVALIFAGETPSFAQATPQGASAPVLSQPAGSAVSQPLSDMPQSPARGAVPQGPHNVPLHPLPQHPVPGGQHANDRALQTKAGAHLAGRQSPLFGGIVQDGSIPPDPNIAVGPNDIVQLVNSEIAVFDKSGTMEAGYPKTLSSLWSALGGACATNNAGDPIVQYDRLADRWLITQLGSLKSPYSECFAISRNGDPAGTYYLYSYDFGSNLNDYPKFGVWPTATNSAYLGTYNLFSNGSSFVGGELCAYDRQAMLSGAPSPASICYSVPNIMGVPDGGYLPSDLDGATAPTDGEPGFFLNFNPNSLSSLTLYQLKPDFANPGSSTLTGPTDLPVAAFQEACGGGTCIPQPGTNRQLDSLGDRLMYRLAYRRFGDHEAMVVNHSVVAGSSVGVRWYELDAFTPGAFSVSHQGTFAPDSAYRWMGSMAMDQVGDIALGYSVSSNTESPGVYLTGRVPTDPTGTMEAETPLQLGNGSQTGYSRWGDYTALQIDPFDDCTFWYTNEYYPQTASYNWYTFIGSFKFSQCGAAGSPDFGLSESPSSMTIAAGSNSPATVTVTSLNQFNSAVTLSTTCAAPITCSLNPASVTPAIGASAPSTLTVSVAANAMAGTYLSNTITGQSGNLTHSTSFSVTVPAPPPPPSPDFTISASLPSLTISRGSTAADTISLTSVGGSSSVTLSISGLPSRVNASFTPNPATATGSSTLSLKVNKFAPKGTYPLTVTGNNGGKSHSTQISLTIR